MALVEQLIPEPAFPSAKEQSPYYPSLFVGRQGILQEVAQFVEDTSDERVSLVEVADLPTIGKTWALNQIAGNCQNTGNPVYMCRGPEELDHLQTELALLQQNGLSRRPVIIFDSMEKYQDDEKYVRAVEETTLPFIKGNAKALVIVAGRKLSSWTEPDIRFHHKVMPLGPLTAEEQAQQSILWGEKNEVLPVPEWVHGRYALGHPGVAAALYRALLSAHPDETQSALFLNDPESERNIVGPIFRETVDKVLLPEVLEPRRALLRAIAPLRVFSPDILQQFAERFSSRDEYINQSLAMFRALTRSLIRDGVVRFSASLNDYRIDPFLKTYIREGSRSKCWDRWLASKTSTRCGHTS